MLELSNLCVSYGENRVLRGINLSVQEGEIVCLIGSNGAGKTTMLRTLSGLLKPETGAIRFLGNPLNGLPPHKIVRMGIAHVPEGRRIFAGLSVVENLVLGSFLRKGDAEVRRDMDGVYELFPVLFERRKQPGGTLSGGEQQMLAIGRAIMTRPKMLLLDEPSLGLAPLVVEDIFRTISEINRRGTTVLLIEQNATIALSVARRGYVLDSGEIVLEGSSQDIASNDLVRRAYLGIS